MVPTDVILDTWSVELVYAMAEHTLNFHTHPSASLMTPGVFSSSLCPHPSSAKKTGCFKVNNCKCIMKDGSGVINLKAMGDADGFLGRLKPVTADNMPVNAEILLSFSPCQAFSQPEDLTGSDCTSVAACLVVRYHRLNRYINHYISFGRHEGNEFHYNDTLKMLSVSYFAHDEQPLTVVHYHCNPNESTSFIQGQSLRAEEPLHIWVESPCACPNACAMGDLGLGTIFLIILSVSAAAYFILGNGLNGMCHFNGVWPDLGLLCAEAFSEQQWSPDLSGAQRVVYDLLPLY
ncbi:hypothetical protein PAMP_022743 [Pampus punctatissimus]